MVARLTPGIARPLGGAVLAAVAVAALAPDPPQDAAIWLATLSALAAAGFVIWRLNVPASYGSMDSTRLRAHAAGNAVMLATCGAAAYVCAALLPPGPALAVAAGFSCAAAMVAVRLWLVADARRRFTVWRR